MKQGRHTCIAKFVDVFLRKATRTMPNEQCAWCNGVIVSKPEVEPSTVERDGKTFYFHLERHCKINYEEQERRLNRAFRGTI